MTTRGFLFYIVLPIVLAAALWRILVPPLEPHVCRSNVLTGDVSCRELCARGEFSLPGLQRCLPWLTCGEIKANVKVIKEIGKGAVKKVSLARWRDYEVAYSTMLTSRYKSDFRHGLSMLIGLQPHLQVVQLIGHCQNSYITEYHPLGSADNFPDILQRDEYKHLDTVPLRFRMCIKYVETIVTMHQSPIGVRVMCDSNTARKTLSQFLITESFDLLANDLDALPKVTAQRKIKCGHQQLFGNFVAPEQLWPYKDKEFVDEDMPGYDEKTDIWKIPEVCLYLLGESPDSASLSFHLFKIHKLCKEQDPTLRPNATEVLKAYEAIYTELYSV